MNEVKERWYRERYNIAFAKGDENVTSYMKCPICEKLLPYEEHHLIINTAEGNATVSSVFGCDNCLTFFAFADNEFDFSKISEEICYNNHLAYVLDVKRNYGKKYRHDYIYSSYHKWLNEWEEDRFFYINLVKLFKMSKLSMESFAIELQRFNENYSSNTPFPTKSDVSTWKRAAKGIPLVSRHTIEKMKRIIKGYDPNIDIKDMFKGELQFEKCEENEMFLRRLVYFIQQSEMCCRCQFAENGSQIVYGHFTLRFGNVIKRMRNHVNVELKLNGGVCNLNIFPINQFGVITTNMKFGHWYEDYHSFECFDKSFSQMSGTDTDYFDKEYEKLKKRYRYLYFQITEGEIFISALFDVPNEVIDKRTMAKNIAGFGIALKRFNDDIEELNRLSNMSEQERKYEEEQCARVDFECRMAEEEGDSWLYTQPKSYDPYGDIDDIENNPDYWEDIYSNATQYDGEKTNNMSNLYEEEQLPFSVRVTDKKTVYDKTIESKPFTDEFIKVKTQYYKEYIADIYFSTIDYLVK